MQVEYEYQKRLRGDKIISFFPTENGNGYSLNFMTKAIFNYHVLSLHNTYQYWILGKLRNKEI